MRVRVIHLPAVRRGACALLAGALLAALAMPGPAVLRALSGWVATPAGAAVPASAEPDTVATMGIRN